MKKKSRNVLVIIIVIAIFYFGSLLLSSYLKYISQKQIYLNIFGASYGTTDTGNIIDRNSLYYFNGDYIRTRYRSINEITDSKNTLIIYLNDNVGVNELYIIYPQMQVFTIYNELVYELKTYSDGLYSFLQTIDRENIE